jgi:hypothetical protein
MTGAGVITGADVITGAGAITGAGPTTTWALLLAGAASVTTAPINPTAAKPRNFLI